MPATYEHNESLDAGIGRRYVSTIFTTTNGSAPTNVDNKNGITGVTRSGEGVFQCTLKQVYRKLLAIKAGVQHSAFVCPVVSAVDLAAKTIDITLYDAAGNADDMTGAKITLELTLSDSSLNNAS